jgi:hypothetical protein
MSTNLFTHLASGQLTPVDQISIEMIKDDRGMPMCRVGVTAPAARWTTKP